MISTLNSCVGLAEVKTKDSSATFCCNYTTWLLAVTSVTRPQLQNTPLLLNSDMTHTETDDSLWPTPIMTTHFSWVVQSVAGNTSFLVSFRFQTCALTEPEKKSEYVGPSSTSNYPWMFLNEHAFRNKNFELFRTGNRYSVMCLTRNFTDLSYCLTKIAFFM